MKTRKCLICGNVFQTRPQNEKTKKYCCIRCRRIAERENVKKNRKKYREEHPIKSRVCPKCHVEFIPPVNDYAKFCSERCQNGYYRDKNHEKSLQWRKNYRERHPDRVKEQLASWRDKKYFGGNRRKAMKRDDFSCVLCGKQYPNYRLAVHHIDENKSNNTLDNLTTLCCSCHAKAHS